MKPLKEMISLIAKRRLVLTPLVFAAGLVSFPALAQEAAQVTSPAAAAQTEQLV